MEQLREELTIETESRKSFGLHCETWGYNTELDDEGFYINPITQRLFDAYEDAWQASRAALVVELPASIYRANEYHIEYTGEVVKEYDEYYEIEDIKNALEQAGVRYK